MTILDKILKVAMCGGFAMGLLFFTPIGGIVQTIIGGGSIIGAAILIFNAVFDSDSLKDFGIKLGGAVALLALALLVSVALPSLPRSGGSDICWDGRANSGC